jgi:mannan endo-1,6-alpha-mannosidase
MDYAKYTRSNKFQQLVGSALVDNSYGRVHDFLGTDHTYNSVVLARWNDDIMWYAQAGLKPNP